MTDNEEDKQEKLPTREELPTSRRRHEKAKEEQSVDDFDFSDEGLRKAFVKSYLQIQKGLKDMGAFPFFIPPEAVLRALNPQEVDSGASKPQESTQPTLLRFSQDELNTYVKSRKEGLAPNSLYWLDTAAAAIWELTGGEISQTSLSALKTYVLGKYKSITNRRKVIGFTIAFLRYLGTVRLDPATYQSFSVYLELPKMVKVRRMTTERIIRREDVVEVLRRIDAAEREGSIAPENIRNYCALTLLAAYTGMRPSTIQRINIGQFRAALKEEKPYLDVLAEQEKNKTQHPIPIHKVALAAAKAVLEHDLEGTDDAKPFFFKFNSYETWLRHQKVPLPRVRDKAKAHLRLSDYRKFTTQYGDSIGWDAENSKIVLAHGLRGVEYEHYKHFYPEDVYDVYLRAWGSTDLTADLSK